MQNIEILIAPVVIVMALSFIFSASLRFVTNKNLRSIVMGLGFGKCCAIAMAQPIAFSEGVIIDLRGLLLGVAVLFAGKFAGAIALACAVSYRMYLGGAGATSGIVGLFMAYGIAVAWLIWMQPRLKPGMGTDAGFGLAITFAMSSLVLLPWVMVVDLFARIVPTLTMANICGAIALGFIFRRELDYTEKYQQRESAATIDPLTNLLNRRGTQEKLSEVYAAGAASSALFYFDIDHFKQINDRYGHKAGDHVLLEVTRRLRAELGEGAVFSRHGGDEFTLLVPNLSRGNAMPLADRLRRKVAVDDILFEGTQISATISIGVYWTDCLECFDDMLALADAQLFQSKAHGRNTISASFAH